jgi:hypothetical protein
MFNESLLSKESKTQKSDLIVPVLLIMAKAELMGHPSITTHDLRVALKDIVVPSGEDLEKTPGDDVSRIDRSVRNLISHNDLVNLGLVKVGKAKSGTSRATLSLTTKGRDYLLNKWISSVDLKNENIIVSEESPRQGFESNIASLALIVVASLEAETGKPVSTTDLREAIKVALPTVHPDDLKPKNENQPWETPLDRAVRNLISHNTLSKKGFIKRVDKGIKLTAAGRKEVLSSFLDLVPDLPSSLLEDSDNACKEKQKLKI